ncbi:uncharacterized protein V1516DRAFT_673616 [Lipomyces oligophaga]|uniref:uncharacterized protein n=1 Tax=Lipomyces oligophaga TaxID=45792 RepID=UPI0034CD9661
MGTCRNKMKLTIIIYMVVLIYCSLCTCQDTSDDYSTMDDLKQISETTKTLTRGIATIISISKFLRSLGLVPSIAWEDEFELQKTEYLIENVSWTVDTNCLQNTNCINDLTSPYFTVPIENSKEIEWIELRSVKIHFNSFEFSDLYPNPPVTVPDRINLTPIVRATNKLFKLSHTQICDVFVHNNKTIKDLSFRDQKMIKILDFRFRAMIPSLNQPTVSLNRATMQAKLLFRLLERVEACSFRYKN